MSAATASASSAPALEDPTHTEAGCRGGCADLPHPHSWSPGDPVHAAGAKIVIVDEQPPPPGVWIDDRLRVADSSIQGRGLFFSTDLPKETVVIRLGGQLVSSVQLRALVVAADHDPGAPHVDTITVHPGRHLVLPPGTSVHFGNHSCDPTLWHTGPYEVATRRAVRAGEEATIDYGTHSGAPGFTMPCRCGSDLCRGVITSDDWQRPDLRARYDGHWVPALEALIRAGVDDA